MQVWRGVGITAAVLGLATASSGASKSRPIIAAPPPKNAIHIAPAAMNLLRRSARIYRACQTWKASILAPDAKNKNTRDRARVAFKRPNLIWVERTDKAEHVLKVCDGRVMWLLEQTPGSGEPPHYNVMGTSRDLPHLFVGAGVAGVGKPLGLLLAGRTGLEGATLRSRLAGAKSLWANALPEASWNSHRCKRVAIEVKYIARKNGEAVRAREVWWLGAQDGLLHRVEFAFNVKGNAPFIGWGEIYHQQLNPRLPDKLFQFKPPAGAVHE